MKVELKSWRALLPALGLGLSVAASHGIARFGYALLLPAMRESLGWTYLQASWMNTANALGYIAGALSGLMLLRRMRASSLFRAGLTLTTLCVAAAAMGDSFEWLFLVRLCAGIGTAWAFSCGGALVTLVYASRPEIRGYATGLFFGGAGLGMILTALTIPALIHGAGASEWPEGWALLALICAVLSIFASGALKITSTHPTAAATSSPAAAMRAGSSATQMAYLIYAASHTAYMFFAFAWLKAHQTDWRLSAAMWTMLGASVFVSGLVWQRALARWPGSLTLALSCLVVAIGSAIPLFALNAPNVLLSAVLVGSAVFVTPAATAVLVRQQLPQESWTRGVMYYTIIFSLGQAAGSWLTGWLADSFNLTVALGCGAAGLLAAAALSGVGSILEASRRGAAQTFAG